MIEANKLIQKMGKDKFVKFVLNNKDKENTAAERQHAVRFGKNIKYRMCEHGKWVIDNYESTNNCEVCCVIESSNSPGVICHSHEYFNIGTGTYGTSSEHRKFAKSKGMIEIG